MLSTAPVLAMPNPHLPFELYTDACDNGMGAVLCQTQNGQERIIAYASKHFLDREKRLYATIEKEACAVIWALDHFHVYLKGARFRIMSDHAPLKWLWRETGASGRLGRWQLKLLEYSDGLVGIHFLRGVDNSIADGLSRIPPVSAVSFEGFSEKQESDPDFGKMKGLVKDISGIWRWKGKCFVPEEFRIRLIQYFHDKGHFGVKRTCEMIVQGYTWPKCRKEVEEFVKKCKPCVQKCFPVASPKSMKSVKFPFQRIHMDFAGPFNRSRRGNRYFLVIQDEFSKYMKIIPAVTCTSSVVLNALYQLFAEEGVPKEVVSDNGTHFVSNEIQKLFELYGIVHTKTPAYHPQSNGFVERAVRTIKDHMRTMPVGDLERNLMEIQWAYNMSVNQSTGYAPFEIVRGRVVQQDPGFLPDNVQSRGRQLCVDWKKIAEKLEQGKIGNDHETLFNIGEKVWVFRLDKKWYEGVVRGMEGTRIANVAVNGSVCRVSVDWIKRRKD